MKKVYCDNCKNNVEYSIRKNYIEEYKNCKVNVLENIGVCNSCQKDVFVEELENANLLRLYDKYREINNLITRDDIIKLREKYNISQRDLTAILGWGKMTINRYERGALANKSHNDILKIIIADDIKFYEMVDNAFLEKRITKKTYDSLFEQKEKSNDNIYKAIIEKVLTHDASIFNGYRKFDIDRVQTLISYMANKFDGVYKTSINKMLFYIDFISFKELTQSITGLQYIKYTYGPVIEKHYYQNIIYNLQEKYVYEEIETSDSTNTIVKSLNNYDLSIFNTAEQLIIDRVINSLGKLSATKISSLSHEEDAWKYSDMEKFISYEYADKIKVSY
ncbi:MAG: DUF4065 domain-containing protein [Clostridia bacterium]|nr:DUF4065 domain-containing protein [Clostridia bacterium]